MFSRRIALISIAALGIFTLSARFGEQKIEFSLTDDPIDVIIPAIEKDLYTLELCIEGIKKNGKSIRDVYVVSPKKLTDNALWISEEMFPFTRQDIASCLLKEEADVASYLNTDTQRAGWYLQQLIKLYSPLVIPNISSNVLVLDSDTLFLNPVSFLNEYNEPLFCPANFSQFHRPYFLQAESLIPDLKGRFLHISGVSHHMLFQKEIITHLFTAIETLHKKPAWRAICECVPSGKKGKVIYAGLSEFELYCNYVFLYSRQGHIRPLRWTEVASLDRLEYYRSSGYHFITCHSYLRDRAKNREYWEKHPQNMSSFGLASKL